MKLLHIETPRLFLRPLKSKDAVPLAKATDETWHDLRQWMRWAIDREKLTNVPDCEDYAINCEQKFLNDEDFTFGGFEKNSGDFVLISRLAYLDREQGCYEFGGYWCRKSYQGKGYMTEAVNAITRYAFAEMRAKKFQITHAAGNHKTRDVMNRLGFLQTDVREKIHNLPDGSIVGEHVLHLENVYDLPTLNIDWQR